MGNERQSNVAEEKKKGWSSIGSIFMHEDGVDKCLMGLGFFGTIADGFSTPLVLFVTSQLMNNIGSASSMDPASFRHSMNKKGTVGPGLVRGKRRE